MPNQNKRALLIEAVIAGGLIVIGIPAGQPLLALAASVGGNWAHSLAERGFQHWRDRWFTDDGVLNQDIAKALCHAFVDAVRQVEHDWKQHRHYQYLRHKSTEQAQLTLDTLRILREDGVTLFQQSDQLAQVARQQQHDRVLSLLDQDESKANEYLKSVLAAFLYGHDVEFIMFITEQLGSQWILRFLEILKDPDEEGTRAWRACQLLWQKSLMLSIEQIQQTTAETAETVRWLKAWAQQLQSQPPTHRDSTGQDALETILHSVHAQLDEMQKTLNKTYDTTLEIKATLEQVYQKVAPAEIAPQLPPFILPQHDIPFFTGREQELKQLETLLLNTQAQGSRVAAIAGLTGTGGMGKSALACHFATLYRNEFRDGVIGLRVDGARVDALAQRFADLASVKIDPERGLSAAEIMQSVFQERQALLIFDDADDATVQKLHPGGNTCAVIVTTRNRALLRGFGIPTEGQIEVKRFSLEETIKLLCQLLGKQRVAVEPDAVKTFHELVGGLPLALRIVGGLLQDQQSISLVKYAEALHDEKNRLKRLRDPDDPDLDVRVSFELSLKYLEEDQITLFACLGACAPEGFSLQTAQVVSEQDEVTVSRNLGRLYRLSLINEGSKSGRYVLQPLLLLFSRELAQERKLLAGAEQRHTEYFVAYAERYSDQSPASMDALAKELDALVLTGGRLIGEVQRAVNFYLILEPFLQRRGYWSRALELLEAFLRAGREQRLPLIVAQALLQKGQFLALLARYSEAEQALLEGKEKTLQVESKHQQRRLEGMLWNSLGGVYQAQGKLKEAEEALHESLQIREEQGDKRGMEMVLNTLGGVYQAQGRLEEAEEALDKSLLIGRELKDKRHMCMVLNTLGGVYQRQGRLKEAEEALHESLLIGREAEDKWHLRIVLNTLGAMYQNQGRLKEAEEVLQESLQIERELENKRGMEVVLNTLGAVYQNQGRLKEAEEVLQESLQIGQELKDKMHLRIVLNTLGAVYLAQGRLKEAEEVLQESLQIQKEQGDKRGMCMVLNTLGAVFQKQGRLKEAEEALRESLAIGEELGEKRHMTVVLDTLRGIYQKQGRLKEAEEALHESLLIGRELEDKWHLRIVLDTLRGIYQKQGRLKEAEEVLQESLQIQKEQGDKRAMGKVLNILGAVYQKQGRLKEAEEVLQESLQLGRELGNKRGMEVVLNTLGAMYQNQGRLKEAGEVLQESLQIGQELKDKTHLRIVLNTLGAVYQKQGRLKEAEEVLQESLQIQKEQGDKRGMGMVLNTLGVVYQKQGRLKEAEEALQESLQLGRELKDKRGMGNVLNTLGSVYQAQGRLKEAEEVLQESLAIGKELEDKRHIGMVLNTLGGVYQAQGRLKEAEEVLQESLAIGEKVENRRGVAMVLNRLGSVYQAQGRLKEAEEVLQESLAIGKELEDKRHIGMVLNTLGSVYQAQGRLKEAEEVLQHVLEIYEQQVESGYIDMAQSLNNLAMLYDGQGKYAEAKLLLQRALAICEQKVELEYPYIQIIRENYSALLEQLARSAEVPSHIPEEYQS